MKEIDGIARRSAASVITSEEFREWWKAQSPIDGDWVVLNNSFLYRKPLIATVKNNQYLAFRVKRRAVDLKSLTVVQSPPDFDSDFKLLSGKSRNLPMSSTLTESIRREVGALGRIVFVLVGELTENTAEVDLKHAAVSKLRFDPRQTQRARIEAVAGEISIVVGTLTNPEGGWHDVHASYAASKAGLVPDGLEAAYAQAFDRLREQARLTLCLPTAGAHATSGDSFIARLRQSVHDQRSEYDRALDRFEVGGDSSEGQLNDAMRIAYNFAGDAIKILQLMVGVADLKAVVSWCTVESHLNLATAFRALPWTKSHKKPSLELYREIIGGARNRAFHNLLAFDRTIDADLRGVQVGVRSLTLLPAHGRQRTEVSFDYEDREVVELLGQLTRAPESEVSISFWKKNSRVMEAFEELLASCEQALVALNAAARITHA